MGLPLFVLHAPLTRWYALPSALMWTFAAANLGFGIVATRIARRPRRSSRLVGALAAANMVWGLLCVQWLLRYAGSASAPGVAHLAAEALFVGGLGVVEWRWRHPLARG